MTDSTLDTKPPGTEAETIAEVDAADQLAERERQVALLSFMPETKSYTMYCKRTGVAIATMQLMQQAGKLPYLAQWKDSTAYHPLFSLPQNHLLAWTRKNWNLLFRSTIDRSTEAQRQQFCIAFMAILHSLNSLDQHIPALPNFLTVNVNMQRLLELAYWYNFLDSKRFKFPTLRISKNNANNTLQDIGVYLDICESIKHDYETSKEGRAEEAKLEAARRAEISVRSSHIRAVSKRALWNWFLSSMGATSNSKKYELPEWVEWKEDAAKLWFASENTQLQHSLEDVDTIEEVFLQECTLGTSVSHAFRRELAKIRDNISNHLTIFEIDWASTIGGSSSKITRVGTDGKVYSPMPEEQGPEPLIGNFNSRVEFIRAKAKWEVRGIQMRAWLANQKQDEPEQDQPPGNTDGSNEDGEDDADDDTDSTDNTDNNDGESNEDN